MTSTTDTHRSPFTDVATDGAHTHPDYAANAPEIWDSLRDKCPVAHTERFEGSWLPLRHEDIAAIAHDTENFSSEGVVVTFWKPEGIAPIGYAPPITSDPPFHAIARRILLPAFSPKEIAKWEPATRETCRELIDELLAAGNDVVDAAEQYAQHIPVRVIAEMLGLPKDDGDKFRDFIHRILENPGAIGEGLQYEDTLDYYLDNVIEDHRQNPRDDLIDFLLHAELNGEPLSAPHIRGTVALLMIAGIDTTWSAIGASLWHLAQVPADRRRLVDDPDVMPFAVEEFLRFYAPVTMARIVAKDDVEVGGQKLNKRDWVLLPFPSANRDPDAFEQADEFIIDRARNRHVAFGLGIHRCLGSNLARMELTVAVEEWMKRIPDFELADPDAVRWSTGQVRGPRTLPVRVLKTTEAS
ncbi:MAG: cytochrome P450 [Acidimicrobiales bacterium]